MPLPSHSPSVAGYRPAAGSTSEQGSSAGAAALLSSLVPAFGSDQAGSAGCKGVLAGDPERIKGLSVANAWFSDSRASTRQDMMYA